MLIAERYIQSSQLKKGKQYCDETDIDVSALVSISVPKQAHPFNVAHSSDFLDLRRRNQTPCGKKKLMRFQTEPEISRSCSLSLYTISVNELNILPWIDFTYLDT
ncbi:hypothetical protein [Coxiella-like endosymbiont]|uniref:hypothetical protein n=1 Tax=Coxiella-like endosymbiont TaxID=1592897 RepID=UPI00215AAA17|nr:hypothetical protein [Coxiella-like endosymbiont]UVE59491.1 hypothetical protein LG660_04055 [Coxiella-like endosymbiont]